MADRVKERRAEARRGARSDTADGEREVLAKLASMAELDRTMGRLLHGIVLSAAPGPTPRLWYGMPAYAKDGKVVCFFQGAQKFKTRYSTLGFSDAARLDDGALWPVAFAIAELTRDVEARIAALVEKAVG